jgi:hypothetical protein
MRFPNLSYSWYEGIVNLTRIWQTGRHEKGYCQLKSNWADFLPLAGNLNTEQSMSYEFVYDQNFGQIHLT